MDAINGIRVSLGANTVLYYALQGLFHPARKVREVYWKIYNNLYIGAQVCFCCVGRPKLVIFCVGVCGCARYVLFLERIMRVHISGDLYLYVLFR